MMKKCILGIFVLTICCAGGANAAVIGVSDGLGGLAPTSTLGVLPNIISAPEYAMDDMATNEAQQAFNEAQAVELTENIQTDQGVILAGSIVDSQMIFLNIEVEGPVFHHGVVWEFDKPVVGVMSDRDGNLEAASQDQLKAPDTEYEAPLVLRGMEDDDFYVIDGNFLTVNMKATQPGDWIRVVTSDNVVPEPATFAMWSLLGLFGAAVVARRKQSK